MYIQLKKGKSKINYWVWKNQNSGTHDSYIICEYISAAWFYENLSLQQFSNSCLTSLSISSHVISKPIAYPHFSHIHSHSLFYCKDNKWVFCVLLKNRFCDFFFFFSFLFFLGITLKMYILLQLQKVLQKK
jgi:hypothetical protein